jgi:hypothetical protein
MDILIFIGSFVVLLAYTGLWEIALPVYAVFFIAFLVSERYKARKVPLNPASGR